MDFSHRPAEIPELISRPGAGTPRHLLAGRFPCRHSLASFRFVGTLPRDRMWSPDEYPIQEHPRQWSRGRPTRRPSPTQRPHPLLRSPAELARLPRSKPDPRPDRKTPILRHGPPAFWLFRPRLVDLQRKPHRQHGRTTLYPRMQVARWYPAAACGGESDWDRALASPSLPLICGVLREINRMSTSNARLPSHRLQAPRSIRTWCTRGPPMIPGLTALRRSDKFSDAGLP
jgi:hypothetical protein